MSIDSVTQVLDRYGVNAAEGSVHVDMVPAELVEQALAHHEGKLASNGSLVVETGKYTGRSPKDRSWSDTPDVHDTMPGATSTFPSPRKATRRYATASPPTSPSATSTWCAASPAPTAATPASSWSPASAPARPCSSPNCSSAPPMRSAPPTASPTSPSSPPPATSAILPSRA
mgnify:CR=1 FL=1